MIICGHLWCYDHLVNYDICGYLCYVVIYGVMMIICGHLWCYDHLVIYDVMICGYLWCYDHVVIYGVMIMWSFMVL